MKLSGFLGNLNFTLDFIITQTGNKCIINFHNNDLASLIRLYIHVQQLDLFGL